MMGPSGDFFTADMPVYKLGQLRVSDAVKKYRQEYDRRCDQRVQAEVNLGEDKSNPDHLKISRLAGLPARRMACLSPHWLIVVNLGPGGTHSGETERAGFEPAVPMNRDTGFRNRLDQPLRHLSKTN